jgi:hypothetical protein
LTGWVLALGIMVSGQAAVVESGAPVVRFRFAAVVPTLPSYTFEVKADGSGTYVGSAAGADGRVQEVKQPLVVSEKTAVGLFDAAKSVQAGGFECASKAKGIANTGVKVLEYGGGSCTYNFSENKTLVGLTDSFQAMAVTLDEGRKLAFKHKYDRLGLNDEMTALVAEVKDGRAIEVGLIAAVLESIVKDGDVLERVRGKAVDLLKSAAR